MVHELNKRVVFHYIKKIRCQVEWKSILSLNSSVLVCARVALIFFAVANVVLEAALVIQGHFSYHWEALTQSQGVFCSSAHQQRGWGCQDSWPQLNHPRARGAAGRFLTLTLVSFSPPSHQGGGREGVSSCESLSCCLGLDSTSS